MNRQEFKQYILTLQQNIRFDVEDDEGAAMYFGELQEVLNALDCGASNREVAALCDSLSIRCTLEKQ